MLEMDATGAAPASARRHVMAVLPRWRLPFDLIPDATQVASELAINALRSTLLLDVPEPTGLRLLCDRRRLVIEAWDCGPAVPARGPAANGTVSGGHGLPIAERLANQWGCQRVSTHVKTVWAELLISDYLDVQPDPESTFVGPLRPASDWCTPTTFNASAVNRATVRG